MFCPQCGKTVSDQKPFCKFCGAKLGGTFAQPTGIKPGFMPGEETLPIGTPSPYAYNPPAYIGQPTAPGSGIAQPLPGQMQPQARNKSHTGALIAVAAMASIAVIALIAVLLSDTLTNSGSVNGNNGINGSALLSPSGAKTYDETLPPHTQTPPQTPPQTPQHTFSPAPTPAPTPQGYVPANARRYMDAVPEDYLEDFILQGYYREYDITELYAFTQEEIALIRNGQYAMSGEVFGKQTNIDYFSAKSWYWPIADGMDDYLNDFQRYNASLCKQYERDMGWMS